MLELQSLKDMALENLSHATLKIITLLKPYGFTFEAVNIFLLYIVRYSVVSFLSFLSVSISLSGC